MNSSSSTSDLNNRDFEFAQRGLLSPLEDPLIFADNSNEVVWNAQAYDFLQTDCPPTANESLWRQGQLCSATPGLYLVTEGVYQVRGLDLANMSIVQIPNTNQFIIVDCLTCPETARKAIELYQEHYEQQNGQKPQLRALFYTHCHIDHFGGAQAVIDFANDQDLRIIGPDGFLKHAVSENIYAGAAMARRSIYMYAEALEKSPTGQIGCGLGQAVATGKSSLVAPNQSITENGVLKPGIDGLEIIYQLTPGTEAPAEVNFFFPEYSALCMAENATHTLHNIQTLRGAPVRDARLWSRYLDESISLFGSKTEVEGDDNLVVTFLSEQRDYYSYLHNETLRLLNNGSAPVEIAEEIQTPPKSSLRTNFRGYYGSVSHNSPHQEAAKTQLAGVYQKLGYGAENGTWRNIYLTGAYELQSGPQPAIGTLDLQSLTSLDLDELYDTVAIRVDGPKAFQHDGVTIDFMVEDMPRELGTANAGWHLRLSHGAVTGHGVQYVPPPKPRDDTVGLTVWVDHKSLVAIVASAATGEPSKLDKLFTIGKVENWDAITCLVQVPNPAFHIVMS
ncbi:hypothetical protein ACHAPE_006983 [Trichoderma viride]